MACVRRLTVLFCLLLNDSQCLEWTSGPRAGDIQYACNAGSFTLPWHYRLTSGDVINEVQWFFKGHSQELIAVLSHGTFLPLPSFSHRARFVENAGLTMTTVTVADSGNYSVEISGLDASGDFFKVERTVEVVVEPGNTLMTSDRNLHLTQSQTGVLDPTSHQWAIELRCGHFTYRGQPPFDIQWIFPSGSVKSSSQYQNGYFTLYLPSPVSGGTYTCRASAHASGACLLTDRDATVAINSMTARVAILEARHDARLADLQADNDDLRQQLAQANQRISIIEDLSSRRVSFHAWHLQSENLNGGDALIVHDVTDNQGNAYDNTTGMFTAPYNGTYFFAGTSGPYGYETSAGIQLVVDDVNTIAAVSAYDRFGAEAASVHAVADLKAGQTMKLSAWNTAKYRGEYTMFTGFLMTPDPY